MKARSFPSLLLLGCLLPLAAGAAAPAEGAKEGAPAAQRAEKGRGAEARSAPPPGEPSLDTLREQCYGGRQRQAPPLVLEQLIGQARRASIAHDLDKVEDAVRRLLQAGGDEARFIPSYGMTLEERNASAHERWKAKRCHELLQRLGGAQQEEAAKK